MITALFINVKNENYEFREGEISELTGTYDRLFFWEFFFSTHFPSKNFRPQKF